MERIFFKKSIGVYLSRDDKIRTCDPTPPRRVRYRAALHPEFYNYKRTKKQMRCVPHMRTTSETKVQK